MFSVNEASADGHALKYIGYEILQKHNLINKFRVGRISNFDRLAIIYSSHRITVTIYRGPLDKLVIKAALISLHGSLSYSNEPPVFTARRYASAVYAIALCLCVSVCLSVSVTSRSSTKMAKHRMTQTTLHDCPGTHSFLMPKICSKFERCYPQRGANTGGVGRCWRRSSRRPVTRECSR